MKLFAFLALLLVSFAVIAKCDEDVEMEIDLDEMDDMEMEDEGGDGHYYSYKPPHKPVHSNFIYRPPPKCPADRKCLPGYYGKGCPTSDTQFAKGSVCQQRKERFDLACRRAVNAAEKECKEKLDCSCSPKQCSVNDSPLYGHRGYSKQTTCEEYCDVKGKKCDASVSVKSDIKVFPPTARKYEPICERVYDKKCRTNWRVQTKEAVKCSATCTDQTCQCY